MSNSSRKLGASLWAKFALACGSLLFFGSVLEIGTRILWNSDYAYQPAGVILKGANRDVVHEGIRYRTNSQGIRNEELQRDKLATERRVLTLGDSFLWGDGLMEPDLVSTQMEILLSEAPERVTVINAGIAGFNTRDEYEQLVRLAPIYDPDLVTLFFFTNDLLGEAHPGGRGGHEPSRRQQIKEYLRRHSKFVALLYSVYKNTLAAKIGVPRFVLPADYYDLDDSKPGWVAFQRALKQIQSFCEERDIRLQFVLIPTLTGLNENYPYAELRDKTSSFVSGRAIPLIDLFDTFARFDPQELWVHSENTHWNGKATRLAAREIVEQIRAQRLLGSAPSEGWESASSETVAPGVPLR